jgi:hypothetical protein
MLVDHRHPPPNREYRIDASTLLGPNPPRSHTHVQQVAGGIPVDLPRSDRC